MFVQFPHPGAEHKATVPEMAWNTGGHARKFLRSHARYLSDGIAQSGDVVFWGEWEPPSTVTELPRSSRREPRYLHEPFWTRTRPRSAQNTDPLVFGDHFLYSNCRQAGNAKLRRLAPGSLVLFGSKLDDEFVLDTVFVVGDSQEFTPRSAAALGAPDWIQAVVFGPLRRSGCADDTFRLYRGRTWKEALDGPYSFTPCQPFVSGERGFARPPIRLDPALVNPHNGRAATCSVVPPERPDELWQDVVAQVDAAGLLHGVEIDEPPLRRARALPPAAGKGRPDRGCAPPRC